MVSHLWAYYWGLVAGNVDAMPLQALIAGVVGLVFRKPLRRAYHALVGERADLEDLRRLAAGAHRIAADLHEHVTGERHPHAPDPESEGK